jgi:hypothetical protein
MVQPRSSRSLELGTGALSLILGLMSTVNHRAEVEVKTPIQNDIVEKLGPILCDGITPRYGSKAFFDYAQRKAQESVDKKIYEEETKQTIEKLTETAKKIEEAVKEWEGEIKDEDLNVGKDSRKRKLEEIEDHAENLKKLAKMMRDK